MINDSRVWDDDQLCLYQGGHMKVTGDDSLNNKHLIQELPHTTDMKLKYFCDEWSTWMSVKTQAWMSEEISLAKYSNNDTLG